MRLFLALAIVLQPTVFAAAEQGAVEEIIQRVIDRARKVSGSSERYLYTKQTAIDEFDSDGKWKARRTKKYEVVLVSGIPYPRLIEVNGKPISGRDLELEREREENFKRLRKRPSRGMERQDMYLTEELASRFIFTLEGPSSVNSRPAWLLSFEPRSGLQEKALADRFINRMGGKIWVDQEDYEIACVKISLRERASLWGGFLGTLDRFTLTLFRTRLPDGMWMNASSEVVLQARKLFNSMHLQVTEQSSRFRKAEEDLLSPE